MKTIIHVNQHAVKANCKEGEPRPVLTCKSYKDNRKGNVVILRDRHGIEFGRFVYRPHKPLPCGAKVWFETEQTVEVL